MALTYPPVGKVTAPVSVIESETIRVTGVVQGVGFRPFVYRLAIAHGIAGHVGNDSEGVFIEATGVGDRLELFVRRIEQEAPPLARIDRIERIPHPLTSVSGFRIVASDRTSGQRTFVPPDAAVCDDCLRELHDSADRRYRHPFITCTNCGPRFTIIRGLPYDRPATTMASFPMCADCRAEYEDPNDRRYHAQPISCHRCGPTLTLVTHGQKQAHGDSALTRAAALIENGNVVAIKGIGGFHLACKATDDAAVAALRMAKARPDKPFPIMVGSLALAEEFAEVTTPEAEQLECPTRPIVLLHARAHTSLSPLIAPGNPLIGVMLPNAPVHHLLLQQLNGPIVLTSANRSGAPIAYRDEDENHLLGLCDALLTNDRPIEVPCDDSVVRLLADRLMPIRRSRGYAPLPVTLGRTTRSVLAVGGELKNTFCISAGETGWVSQHIGDMENLETLDAFSSSVDRFRAMYDIEPEVIVADTHPRYLSSQWARSFQTTNRTPGSDGMPELIGVQHHHAHIGSVMAEHGLDPHAPILGFAFDGTGFGDNGAIWGGEVLRADVNGFDRLAWLRPVTIAGGDEAVRLPYRTASAYLRGAGVRWSNELPSVLQMGSTERRLLRQQLVTGVNCISTTSMGRLFDTVSSLLGLRHRVSYEAQAAIELEIAAIAGCSDRNGYAFGIDGSVIDWRPVVRALVGDYCGGASAEDIALKFHRGVAAMVVEVTRREAAEGGYVALSGGVFQNALLTNLCLDGLVAAGYQPLINRSVPTNDGGLALGQAFIGAHCRSRNGAS